MRRTGKTFGPISIFFGFIVGSLCFRFPYRNRKSNNVTNFQIIRSAPPHKMSLFIYKYHHRFACQKLRLHSMCNRICASLTAKVSPTKFHLGNNMITVFIKFYFCSVYGILSFLAPPRKP